MSDTKPDLDAIERQLTDDPTDLGVTTARALVAYARTLDAEREAAEAERDQYRDTLALRSAAHNRLAQRLDQVRALVQDMQDGAEREKGPCPDGECGACSIGNAAILILRVLDGDQQTETRARAEQQIADLAGLTIEQVREVGGIPDEEAP